MSDHREQVQTFAAGAAQTAEAFADQLSGRGRTIARAFEAILSAIAAALQRHDPEVVAEVIRQLAAQPPQPIRPGLIDDLRAKTEAALEERRTARGDEPTQEVPVDDGES